MIERYNRDLKDMLYHFIDSDRWNWDEWLEFVAMVYCNSVYSATNETPFYLTHARDMILPYEDIIAQHPTSMYAEGNYSRELQMHLNLAFTKAREANNTYTKRRNEVANSKRRTQSYEVGDLVYLKNQSPKVGVSRKLNSNWVGPFRIVDKKSPVVFKIKEIQGTREQVVHADRLKLCSMVLMSDISVNLLNKVDEDQVHHFLFDNVQVLALPTYR